MWRRAACCEAAAPPRSRGRLLSVVALGGRATYITRALGEPPEHERTRGHWQRGVRIIENYRTAHEVTDPTDALGPQLRDPVERIAWHDVRGELASNQRVLRAMNSLQHELDRATTHAVEAPGLGRSAAPRGPDLGIDP